MINRGKDETNLTKNSFIICFSKAIRIPSFGRRINEFPLKFKFQMIPRISNLRS